MYTNLPKTIQDSDIQICIENYELAKTVVNSIKYLELTKICPFIYQIMVIFIF
jgi:hypothetical protein